MLSPSLIIGAVALSLGAAGDPPTTDLDAFLEGGRHGVKPSAGYSTGRPAEGGDRRHQTVRRVTCAAAGAYRECPAPGHISQIRLDGGPCRLGLDWGVGRRMVWVDRHCRARFTVTGGQSWAPSPPPPPQDLSSVSCSSEDWRYRECAIPTAFSDIRVQTRWSDAPCRRNREWGLTKGGIWVDNGCRARFSYRQL